jgi:hypothetical protein
VQRLERVGLDADLTGQTAAELFGLAVGAEDRIARRSATRE